MASLPYGPKGSPGPRDRREAHGEHPALLSYLAPSSGKKPAQTCGLHRSVGSKVFKRLWLREFSPLLQTVRVQGTDGTKKQVSPFVATLHDLRRSSLDPM